MMIFWCAIEQFYKRDENDYPQILKFNLKEQIDINLKLNIFLFHTSYLLRTRNAELGIDGHILINPNQEVPLRIKIVTFTNC